MHKLGQYKRIHATGEIKATKSAKSCATTRGLFERVTGKKGGQLISNSANGQSALGGALVRVSNATAIFFFPFATVTPVDFRRPLPLGSVPRELRANKQKKQAERTTQQR